MQVQKYQHLVLGQEHSQTLINYLIQNLGEMNAMTVINHVISLKISIYVFSFYISHLIYPQYMSDYAEYLYLFENFLLLKLQ